MFKPSIEKSEKNHQLINSAFYSQLGDNHKYTLVYAYYKKSGLFEQRDLAM